MTSPVTFTGPVTVNITVDVPALADAVTALLQPRLDALEAAVTAPLTTVDEALTALAGKVDTLTGDETSLRAAFDAQNAAVTAFLQNLPPAGGTLSAEQAAQAQTLLDHVGSVSDAIAQQTADEQAEQAEVPAP